MSTEKEGVVIYNVRHSTALIMGPGGFTQVRMRMDEAEAIARAFGVTFKTEGDQDA